MYDKSLIDMWFDRMFSKEITEASDALRNEKGHNLENMDKLEAEFHSRNIDTFKEYIRELNSMRANRTHSSEGSGYSKAVTAIMDSDVTKYYKRKAIKVLGLREDRDSDYYEAVSAIAKKLMLEMGIIC